MLNQNTSAVDKKQFGEFLGALMKERAPASASIINAADMPAPAIAQNDEPPAIAFLRLVDAQGWHNLVALDPAEKAAPEARTFPPSSWKDMGAWISARAGTMNLYFSVNEPKSDARHKKLTKDDISAIRCVCADLDPKGGAAELEAERQRLSGLAGDLANGPLPPAVAVDTGGGVQLFWLLDRKLPAAEWRAEIEGQGRSIAAELGGDDVWNIDRVMRLPGVPNIPTASKRSRGRVERVARVLATSQGRTKLDDLARKYPPVAVEASDGDKSNEIANAMRSIDLSVVQDVGHFDDLPADLKERFRLACEKRSGLALLWETGEHGGTNETASAGRFALASRLKQTGQFDVNEFGQLLWVWPHAVRAGDDLEIKISEREIARCWTRAEATEHKATDPSEFFEILGDDVPKPATTKKQSPLKLISIQDAAASALDDGAKPLVKGLLDQGALSVLYGESNVGKTFVVLDLAYSIAAGLPWCYRRTAKTGVVYIAAEGGRGAKLRVRALMGKFEDTDTAAVNFKLILSSVNLRQHEVDLQRLIDAVRDAGDVGFVVVDTLSRALAGGEENSSVDMGGLVRNVDILRQATGAHVMMVHHSGKTQAKGARGHSLLRAATDTEIEIGGNEILVTKQRDLDGNFRQSFRLDTVQLGLDRDGEAVTSCVVEYVLKSEVPAAEATGAENDVLVALRALEIGNPAAGRFKPEGIGQALPVGTKPIATETIRSHLRKLEEKGLVVRAGRGFWRSKAVENASTAFSQGSGYEGHETAPNNANGRETVDGIFQ